MGPSRIGHAVRWVTTDRVPSLARKRLMWASSALLFHLRAVGI